jgi:hypothetical protein
MSRLFLDLAEAECQLASLALVSGQVRLAVRSLERATRYLTLRREPSPSDAPTVLPMWGGD